MNGTNMMTNLNGTPSQIDQAFAIREQVAAVIDQMIAHAKATATPEKYAIANQAVCRVFSETAAQWWIDRRDCNPKSILLEEIAEVLKEIKQTRERGERWQP